MSSALTITNVQKAYAKKPILDNLSFSADAGEFIVLVGPSGCGKSTLLRSIAGLESLNSGQIAIGDADVTSLPPKDRDIAMVFQDYALYPHKSVYENIAFGVRLYRKVSKAEMDEIVEVSLTRAALWDEVKDKLDKSGLGLSGGQQQRLCVARGIAVQPEILLLDEPASALDPLSTSKLESALMELKDTVTIVIVTHNLQQAARISDHTGFMLLGRMLEFRPSSDAFVRPETEAMRDYVTGRYG